MIRKLLLAAIAACSITEYAATAQENYPFQIGYGGLPVTSCKGSMKQAAFIEIPYIPFDTRYLPIEATVAMGLTRVNPYSDFNGIPSQVEKDFAFEILLNTRYFWRFSHVRPCLYSGGAIGLEARNQVSGRGYRDSNMLAYHFTAIGIRTSGRFFVNAELGYGHLGLVHVGIGYRFMKK